MKNGEKKQRTKNQMYRECVSVSKKIHLTWGVSYMTEFILFLENILFFLFYPINGKCEKSSNAFQTIHRM